MPYFTPMNCWVGGHLEKATMLTKFICNIVTIHFVGLLIPLLCVGTLRRALQSGDLQQVTVEPKVSNKVFDPSTYVVSDDGSESEEEYEEVAEDPDQLVSSVLAPKLAWNA